MFPRLTQESAKAAHKRKRGKWGPPPRDGPSEKKCEGGRGSGDTIIGEMPDPSCVNITQNIDQLAG